jgi:hypothetical protein
MNWEGSGRTRNWPNFKVLSRNSPWSHLGRPRKTSVKIAGRDLNPGPPEHDTGALTIQPRRSMFCDIGPILRGLQLLTCLRHFLLLWNLNVHFRILKGSPLDCILSHLHPLSCPVLQYYCAVILSSYLAYTSLRSCLFSRCYQTNTGVGLAQAV